MKLYFKILFTIMVVLLSSCKLTDLNLQDDPNEASPETAQVDFVYNSVLQDFEAFFTSSFFLTAGPARMTAMTGGFTYNDSFSPVNYNFLWRVAYSGLLPDIHAIVAVAEEKGFNIHSGSSKIMEAYILVTMADLFGDIPYSQALQGTDIISPEADTAEEIYAVAYTLIDEAIAELADSETSPKPAIDIFYDGDAEKWMRFGRSLKLKMYNQTRLVDNTVGTKIDALIADGVIENMADDFQYQYGVSRNVPNARHPFYNNSYEANDGTYMSNYFMWLLLGEKRDSGGNVLPDDPRARFYFYRQDGDLSNEDENVWGCIWSDTPDPTFRPAHYTAVDPDMPYCIARIDGYFGRDHGNGSGIPPDGGVRTVWGVYPAAGLFDDNSFDFTQENGTTGALGEGIAPILLANYVFFMRAEAALMAGTSDDPRTMLETAIQSSMDKVRSFEDKINVSKVVGQDLGGNDLTLKQVYLDPLDSDVADYIADVMAMYDAATSNDERLDIIMKEYLIALYGNGIEAYNNLRRTSKPANIQPLIDVSGGGSFIWSAFYPADYVNLNQNADQKTIDKKLFWDTSSADAVK